MSQNDSYRDHIALTELLLDTSPVGLKELGAVAHGEVQVRLGPEFQARVQASRGHLLAHLERGTPVYGTNTGVGALYTRAIPPEQGPQLSRNIVLSHACGVGAGLSPLLVRAIMFSAVLNLGQGYSGVRLELLDMLVEMLNRKVIPLIPSRGSIGSLTHMASVGCALMGLGTCLEGEREVPAEKALQSAGLQPLELLEGEGLSLVSGTPSLMGIGGLATLRAHRLSQAADLAAALSFEALRANPGCLDPRVHRVRNHSGQSRVAATLLRLTMGSELLSTENLQDCLSLRTTPQVHGSSLQTIERAVATLEVELNSATDNPLIFPDAVLSACNAHGEPMAQCLDGLSVALAELGNISERRTDRLLNFRVNGLPPFLTEDPGLNSGWMIPQYVSAYLVAENKILSHPVSVDSIPMSAFQEDHVNMGTMAALMAFRVARNLERILAIEMLTARAALGYRLPLQPGPTLQRAVELLDGLVPPKSGDRVLGPDIETLALELGEGRFYSELESL